MRESYRSKAGRYGSSKKEKYSKKYEAGESGGSGRKSARGRGYEAEPKKSRSYHAREYEARGHQDTSFRGDQGYRNNERNEGSYGNRGSRSYVSDREYSRETAAPDTFREEREPDANRIEGRNAVIEAFRSGRTIDKLFILEGSYEGAMQTVRREAAKHGTPVKSVSRQRLDQMSVTGHHQGVIAEAAAYSYAEIDDLFDRAREKDEDPFFILLDNIEDPHNLGAIIRTANLAGAHGVIIPKDRAVGLTAVVAKASAGAINYTPVVRVTNLARTIEELKERGMWFVCADMDGTPMTQLDMTGSIGLVIGAEGEGVSRLVREKCDMVASIPQKGEIDSLNASVAAGVLAYEIVRQRGIKG